MPRIEPGERHLAIARLREEIRRIERRPARREGLVPCGVEAVDAALPGGGFARGALTELAGGPASGKCAVALSLLARLGDEDLFAWVDGRGELYPPAAAARGVDLGRLLVVRPPPCVGRLSSSASPPAPAGGDREGGVREGESWRAALWAAEAALASGAFAAVVMEVPLPRSIPGADTAARRLQAAAERGGAVGLWLAASRGGLRLPGAVRLELAAHDGRIAARREGRSVAGAGATLGGGGGRAA